jgi:hypothetical protein
MLFGWFFSLFSHFSINSTVSPINSAVLPTISTVLAIISAVFYFSSTSDKLISLKNIK